MSQQTLNIKYIGNKATKRDTVCHSGIEWAGKGDVQPVPGNIAAKLLRHRDVWCLADGKAPVSQIPVVPEPTDPEDKTPLGRKLGLGNAPLPQSGEQAQDNGIGTGENAEGAGSEAVSDDQDEVQQNVSLIELLRGMPKDSEHISQRGKPIIAKVRELANNPNLKMEDVAKAWKQVIGDG
ncbi:hypothetical protein [Microbulbifer sp. TYP-18]|uniref:hypothetical protein n=1 Tax=Microbulbifer sp. TYP-18 TaxID=3230024 RepID=UPI0034C5CEDA